MATDRMVGITRPADDGPQKKYPVAVGIGKGIGKFISAILTVVMGFGALVGAIVVFRMASRIADVLMVAGGLK